MFSYGVTDLVTTVTVPKSEYESLVRESEELRSLKKYIRESSNTLPLVVLKAVLGIEEVGNDDKKEDSSNSNNHHGRCANCNSSK